MALALVHFRLRTNKASVTDTARHYRPGDVQVVSDNPATGSGEEGEEYLLVTLPGVAADWEHLTTRVYVDGDPGGRILKIRRYYIDLSKLKVAETETLDDRKPLSGDRRLEYAKQSKTTHALHLARLGGRQAELDKLSPIVTELDRLDTELVKLRMAAVAVDASWVIDRGEM